MFEAREMINARACELLQAVQGFELLSGDGLEGFLGDLAVVVRRRHSPPPRPTQLDAF